jgi:hypothetical protein
MAECNETIVSLEQCRDLYPQNIEIKLLDELIDTYDKAGGQFYNLSNAWTKFKRRRT